LKASDSISNIGIFKARMDSLCELVVNLFTVAWLVQQSYFHFHWGHIISRALHLLIMYK